MSGHEFSRADEPFILHQESASADGTRLAARVFSGLVSRADEGRKRLTQCT